MKRLKLWIRMIRTAVNEFVEDNATKLSASLAFYTIFSIGPLFLVIIALIGLFFERQAITATMADQLRLLLGPQGAGSVISIIESIRAERDAATFSVVGFAILLFGASIVFVEMQTSINYILSIRAKPKKGWLKFIKNRLLSFSLIIGLGFLLVVSLVINMLTDALTDRLADFVSPTNSLLLKGFNIILLFLIISFIFSVIYKVLPDAFISWRDAIVGAAVSAVLFLMGKFLIGYYLGNSNMANSYGAAASVIIVLVWVYCSAMILYFGAEFTKVYSLSMGRGIQPNSTAVFIVKRESKELPENRKKHPETDEILDS